MPEEINIRLYFDITDSECVVYMALCRYIYFLLWFKEAFPDVTNPCESYKGLVGIASGWMFTIYLACVSAISAIMSTNCVS